MDLVRQGRYAFYLDETSFALEISKDPSLTVAKNLEPYYAPYSIALPKNSFYSRILQKQCV